MRRALVTGVSHGIGLEVARMLVAEGWSVVGISRRPFDVPGVRAYSLDVSVAHQVHRLSWMIGSEPLDALVHCAAIQGPIGPLEDSLPSAWLETIRINLLGSYLVTRECLPALHASDDARILLFAGGGAFNARPDYSAYAVSKAGVVSLMETLAEELRHSGVTVNCVSPGFVPTGIDPHAAVFGSDPDGSLAMERAVACVRHLLGPQTRGLSGRTVSAEFDDWSSIDQTTVASVNASVQGTRMRHTIQQVARMRGVA